MYATPDRVDQLERETNLRIDDLAHRTSHRFDEVNSKIDSEGAVAAIGNTVLDVRTANGISWPGSGG